MNWPFNNKSTEEQLEGGNVSSPVSVETPAEEKEAKIPVNHASVHEAYLSPREQVKNAIVDGKRIFSVDENWGNLDKMDPRIISAIIELRKAINLPIVIHANGAYATTGHGTGSRHYFGEAIDFHIKGVIFPDAIKLVETWIEKTKFQGGLGIYPDWNNPGFHLDCYTGKYGSTPKRRWGMIGRGTAQHQVAYSVARKKAGL